MYLLNYCMYASGLGMQASSLSLSTDMWLLVLQQQHSLYPTAWSGNPPHAVYRDDCARLHNTCVVHNLQDHTESSMTMDDLKKMVPEPGHRQR